MGPSRLFGPGAQYNVFLWALLAGALAPIPLWYYQRRFPNTRLKYINLPVLLNGPSAAPPATGINFASFFIVGFIFRKSTFSFSSFQSPYESGADRNHGRIRLKNTL